MRIPILHALVEAAAIVWKLGLRARQIVMILLLTGSFAALEGISIGLFYPVLAFIESGANAFTAQAPFPLNNLGRILDSFGGVNLPSLLALLLVPLLFRQLIQYKKITYTMKLGLECLASLIRRASHSYLLADIQFHDDQNRGETSSRLYNDTRYAANLLQLAAEFISSLFLLIVYFIITLVVSWPLAVIVIPLFMLLGIIFRRQNQRAVQVGAELPVRYGALARAISEVLQGARTIKLRCAETSVIDRIAAKTASLRASLLTYERLRAMVEATTQPLLFIAAIVVFYVSISSLGLRLAELLTFAVAISRVIPLYSKMAGIWIHYSAGAQSFLALYNLIEKSQSHRRILDGKGEFSGLKHNIRFDHVSFDYSAANADEEAPALEIKRLPALHDICFSIARGETVAIVGRSGAGKSTLAGLLVRFYDPQSGTVFFDDSPIQNFSLFSLRKSMSAVAQDPFLFDDTIRENLLFGLDRHLSEDEIWAVLRQANCADFVAGFPDGLDTYVGERGARISGGQRQRLALACALASRPDLLILDEPTSALDSESELAIQQTLSALRGKTTIIIIAHRLATIRMAQRILLLEEGRIVAQGQHADLISRCEAYQRLFLSQAA